MFNSLLKNSFGVLRRAQDERIGSEKISTKSVYAELVEACSAVFQQLLKVRTGIDTLNLEC